MTIDLNNYQDIRYLVLMNINSNKSRWWADNNFGSNLFLIQKSKISKYSANEVKRIISDCLDWIVKDNLAKNINVNTEIEKTRINWTVEIIKPDNNTELIEGVWDNV
ncbi:hypothetical protein WESB_0340 [Brachyspira pilosicoli WesB]|uniref:Phage protein GP46 n=1 Tax=Brachyspira pilosicoli WesB TaxID=1161918 RepID=K0JI99_BRAPL|nr:phage GP46 family protein [Brachyspira pilosicoli]CCG55811.1 hypothetical protein WESB_0340 [Brachyspira pilosicoli WesB]